MLTKRLESRVWEGMLDPESPLYEPTLLGMLQKPKNKKAPWQYKLSDICFHVCQVRRWKVIEIFTVD